MLALSFAVHAQVYEWIDQDGVRQFSDRKPIDVEYRIRGADEQSLSTYS
ncbi:MAG: DUF4124 domain-containing protein, partial [Xanthomonadaceae bacterium]|nr:DUF4124 domain-containing protein [Xanthomonadaceae bacterium]